MGQNQLLVGIPPDPDVGGASLSTERVRGQRYSARTEETASFHDNPTAPTLGSEENVDVDPNSKRRCVSRPRSPHEDDQTWKRTQREREGRRAGERAAPGAGVQSGGSNGFGQLLR